MIIYYFEKLEKIFGFLLKLIFYIYFNSKNRKYTCSYISDLKKLIKLNLNLNDFHKEYHFKKF